MRCVTSNGKPTLRGLAHFLCSYVRLYSVCCEKSELSKRVFHWPIILNRQYKCAIIQRNSDRMEKSAIFFPIRLYILSLYRFYEHDVTKRQKHSQLPFIRSNFAFLFCKKKSSHTYMCVRTLYFHNAQWAKTWNKLKFWEKALFAIKTFTSRVAQKVPKEWAFSLKKIYFNLFPTF